MQHKINKTSFFFLMVFVIAGMLVIPLIATPQEKMGFKFNEKKFAQQLSEVKAKYPLVAMAYLESIEALIEIRQETYQLTLQDAINRYCEVMGCPNVVSITPTCPECPPARNEQDLNRYLSCVEKRIQCVSQ